MNKIKLLALVSLISGFSVQAVEQSHDSLIQKIESIIDFVENEPDSDYVSDMKLLLQKSDHWTSLLDTCISLAKTLPKAMENQNPQEPFLKNNLAEKMRQESMLLGYSFIAPVKIRRGNGPHRHQPYNIARTTNLHSLKILIKRTGQIW